MTVRVRRSCETPALPGDESEMRMNPDPVQMDASGNLDDVPNMRIGREAILTGVRHGFRSRSSRAILTCESGRPA